MAETSVEGVAAVEGNSVEILVEKSVDTTPESPTNSKSSPAKKKGGSPTGGGSALKTAAAPSPKKNPWSKKSASNDDPKKGQSSNMEPGSPAKDTTIQTKSIRIPKDEVMSPF